MIDPEPVGKLDDVQKLAADSQVCFSVLPEGQLHTRKRSAPIQNGCLFSEVSYFQIDGRVSFKTRVVFKERGKPMAARDLAQT